MRLRTRTVEDNPPPINPRKRRKLDEENNFSLDENQVELFNKVLGRIFSFLDLDSLEECRLVSKTWNEQASEQLGHKSWFKIYWKKISGCRCYYPNQEALATLPDENGKKETDYLFEFLSNLFNPSLFKNFEFDFEWLMNKKFQDLMKKFGSTLQRITIRDQKQFEDNEFDEDYSARMEIVCEILMKWCPKLTTFQMGVVRKTEGLTLLPIQIKWVEPSNIRDLRIEGVLTEFQSDFWINLIKTTPCLSKLSISCVPPKSIWNPDEDIAICESFFQKLSKLPKVTKKLEDFSWNAAKGIDYSIYSESDLGTVCNIFKPVSAMEFSSKLKKIKFGPSEDSLNGNKRYITRVLEKLNAYGTEEIFLTGSYYYWFSVPQPIHNQQQYDNEDTDDSNKESDDDGSNNEERDDDGSNNEEIDDDGSNNEEIDDDGSNNEEIDDDGSNNEEIDGDGSNNEKSDDDGSNNEKSDDDGSNNEESDDDGSYNEESDDDGSNNEESDENESDEMKVKNLESGSDSSDDSQGDCEDSEFESEDDELDYLWKVDHIPLMSKVTSIKSLAAANYGLGGVFDFVEKFPNLKTLDMSPNWSYRRLDYFESELNFMCESPHYNLQTLIVKPAVNKRKTLESIIKIFPNLSSLQFKIYDVSNQNEISVKDALSIVSKCEHLENLTVSFLKEDVSDLCEALGVVKDFPKLEHLTLNGVDRDSPLTVNSFTDELLQLSNLKTSVSFNSYKISKFQTVKMKKFCEENHIRVNFIPYK